MNLQKEELKIVVVVVVVCIVVCVYLEWVELKL
jgi:hypothetical protein